MPGVQFAAERAFVGEQVFLKAAARLILADRLPRMEKLDRLFVGAAAGNLGHLFGREHGGHGRYFAARLWMISRAVPAPISCVCFASVRSTRNP